MDESSLVCCGGFEGRFYVDDVERYDWSSNTWTQLPRMPVPCNSTSACLWGRKIILAGGDTGTDATSAVSSLNTDNAIEWETLPSLPCARAYSASYVKDNTLVVCGGGYGDVILDKVESLDLLTGKWHDLPEMPSGRSKCGYTSITGRFFMVGGEEYSHLPTDKVMCLYTQEQEWEEYPALPVPLRRCSAVKWDEKIVVIGGLTIRNQTEDRILLFDPRTMVWQTLTSMPHSRYGFGAAVVGDKLVIVGGSQKMRMKVYQDSVDVLDLNTLSWQNLQPVSKKMIHPTLVAV